MSSLTTADLMTVAALVDFIRGKGHVLDFNDRDFSQFFGREIGVNIDDPKFSVGGSSKGKRLRAFLESASNNDAARVLEALWAVRATWLSNNGQRDPVGDADARYLEILQRVGGKSINTAAKATHSVSYANLQSQLMEVSTLKAQARGYAFQSFLYGVFEANGANPRTAFRNRGEEIDGSFSMAGNTYLLEAKWEARPVGAASLHAFEGKIIEKSQWGRGLFISYVGFSPDGLQAFGRAKRTLCMDGADLSEMISRKLSLEQVLDAKARRAVENGLPFNSVREIF